MPLPVIFHWQQQLVPHEIHVALNRFRRNLELPRKN